MNGDPRRFVGFDGARNSDRLLVGVEIDGVVHVDYADAAERESPAERAQVMLARLQEAIERLSLPWHQRIILRIRRMFRR